VIATRNSILAVVVFLLAVGLLMVYSTTIHISGNPFENPVFLKQCAWAFVAFLAMLFFANLDYHRLQKLAFPALLVSLGLLSAVLHPKIGTVAYGARRWIRFGEGIGVQPSEFAKVALILFIAAYLSRKERSGKFVTGFLVPMGLAALVFVLILKEPDFGTGLLIGAVVLGLVLLSGARIIYAVLAAALTIPGLAYLILSSGYRRQRFLAFLDPWKYSRGIGYHITQSLIALGSGGLTGVGIGASQQKFYYLPQAPTDFVFAILGEELGFFGASLVVILFLGFVWLGMRVAASARDRFGFLLASGVTLLIGLQAAINIAVVSGSVPTKGLSLPFIGYGGSSLFFTMAGVGMLLNVASQAPEEPASSGIRI